MLLLDAPLSSFAASRDDSVVLRLHQGEERGLDGGAIEAVAERRRHHQTGIQSMKRKHIVFNSEAMVGSVEALAAHVRGERKLTLRTHAMPLPEPIEPLKPKDVADIRHQLKVSQSVFAALLNVPKVTAISWEKGRRKPTGAALRLLDLIRKKPNLLQEV